MQGVSAVDQRCKKIKRKVEETTMETSSKKKPQNLQENLESDRLRKKHLKIIKSLEIVSSSSSNSQSPTSSQPSPSLLLVPTMSLLTPVIASRSLKKAEVNLSQSPRKKAEVIKNLASTYQIRIQLKETRRCPRKKLSDDKKAWLTKVLCRSDLTYTNPGRADNVYIGKIDGERQYLPRQYLLWSLKDLHDILNGTSASIGQAPPNCKTTFSEKLTLSQQYDFIKNHNQYIHKKNIPHTSCFCDTCEDSVLLAKGINSCKNVPNGLPEKRHDIVERYSCSDQKACMFNECSEWKEGKLCKLATDDNWSDSNSDSDFDANTNKHVAKVRITLPFGEAVDMFKTSVTVLKKHIYSKRVHNREYNEMKESLDHYEILAHIDYAKSYKNVHQNEIQSAYFGKQHL